MARSTTNLKLSLPNYEDAADVLAINQNMEIIDRFATGWAIKVRGTMTVAGVLELSGEDFPAEKDGLTVQFVSPAAAADGLQAKFAGSDTLYPILSTSEGKEPIQAGAWDAGVPVSLTVSGGSCFFKTGAGDYGTLPPQTQITAKAGNAQVEISLVPAADSPYFAGTLLVRKEGSAPQKISDGVKIDVGAATAYTDTGLTNNVEYFYRAFAYSPKKFYQTELTGAVASALPRGEPTSYEELATFTTSTSWTVPEDEYYQVYVVGKGGNGGAGSGRGAQASGLNGYGGGGGGAGGASLYRAYFTEGTVIPITVTASLSSFGSYCSATSGTAGQAPAKKDVNAPGGQGGTSSGGNIANAVGGTGGRGGIGGTSPISSDPGTEGERGGSGVNGAGGGYTSDHSYYSNGHINYVNGGGGGGGGGGISIDSRRFNGGYGGAATYADGGGGTTSISYSENEAGYPGGYGGGGGGGGGGANKFTTGKAGGAGGAGVVIIEKGVYN